MDENFANDDMFSRRNSQEMQHDQNFQIGNAPENQFTEQNHENNTNNPGSGDNSVPNNVPETPQNNNSNNGDQRPRGPKLTKGQMKRYKVLLATGMPEEEARLAAKVVPMEQQQPMGQQTRFQPPKRLQPQNNRGIGPRPGPMNRNQYDHSTYKQRREMTSIRSLMDINAPPHNFTPNARIIYGQQNSNRMVFERNFVEIADGRNPKQIRVGVLPLNYPVDLLTNEKMKEIEEQILKKVVLQKHSIVKPGFLTCIHKIGYMMFICRDRQTVNWLGNLYNWKSENLQVVDMSTVALTNVMEVTFPLSSELSTGTVLDMIESQNYEIFTGNWKVISEVVPGTALHLIIAMDNASLDVLEREKFKLFYRFTVVKFDHCLGLEKDIIASHKRFAATNNLATNPTLLMGGREAYGAVTQADTDIVQNTPYNSEMCFNNQRYYN
ncbi:uncharacterized protein LOC134837012 [Culicoides brevitarsis]|uniref:uncharacterized protein LOC134837012 n=1 Tax=Culicoides brevitarsis TaxID=469753 RepID=UPI00307C583B